MATADGPKHRKVAADLFAKARLEFDFTYDELAEEIGICGRHAQHVEYGDRQPSAAIFLHCLELMRPDLVEAIKKFIRTPVVRPKPAAGATLDTSPGAGLGVSPA